VAILSPCCPLNKEMSERFPRQLHVYEGSVIEKSP
jgi:hypothetical protein